MLQNTNQWKVKDGQQTHNDSRIPHESRPWWCFKEEIMHGEQQTKKTVLHLTATPPAAAAPATMTATVMPPVAHCGG
jgi:hypothetical protein